MTPEATHHGRSGLLLIPIGLVGLMAFGGLLWLIMQWPWRRSKASQDKEISE